MWDGNAICALLGDNLVVGCGGFGESVPTALRDVANNIDADDLTATVPGIPRAIARSEEGPAPREVNPRASECLAPRGAVVTWWI